MNAIREGAAKQHGPVGQLKKVILYSNILFINGVVKYLNIFSRVFEVQYSNTFVFVFSYDLNTFLNITSLFL